MQPSYQLVPVPLPTATYSASGRSQVNTDAIPAEINGRPAHLARLDFEFVGTPTLSSGSLTSAETAKICSKITIKDGVRTLFDESLEALRVFEALENGSLLRPEHDDIATATEVAFVRSWTPGPKSFLGGLVDFVLSPGAMDGTPIELNWNPLTTIDANLTALSLTVQVVAWMCVLDDVRIAPKLERKTQSGRSDETITGENDLYAFVGVSRPAYASLAAGDLANIQVLNSEAEFSQVHVTLLEKAYHEDMKVNGTSIIHGEPRSATDDNPKVIAGGGTAFASASNLISPIIWSPLGSRISKLVHRAKGKGLRLKFSGSLNPALFHYTRITERSREDAGAYLELAAKALKIDVTDMVGDVATASKKAYSGPRKDFFPLKFKVR